MTTDHELIEDLTFAAIKHETTLAISSPPHSGSEPERGQPLSLKLTLLLQKVERLQDEVLYLHAKVRELEDER